MCLVQIYNIHYYHIKGSDKSCSKETYFPSLSGPRTFVAFHLLTTFLELLNTFSCLEQQPSGLPSFVPLTWLSFKGQLWPYSSGSLLPHPIICTHAASFPHTWSSNYLYLLAKRQASTMATSLDFEFRKTCVKIPILPSLNLRWTCSACSVKRQITAY